MGKLEAQTNTHVSPVEHPKVAAPPSKSGSTTRYSFKMKIGIAAFVLFICVAAAQFDQYVLKGLTASYGLKTKAEIPGDSPIETCLDEELQLVKIESLSIDPNPPVPGTNLTISAKGLLGVDLVDGAYVDVLVRYGFITLVNRRYDLCELLPEVDMECPVKAGLLSLTRSVEIPENVPPGEYFVNAKAYTVDDSLLTCLTATVEIEG